MQSIIMAPLGGLFLAVSVYLFFPQFQEYAAGAGILAGLVLVILSGIGLILFLKGIADEV